MKNGTTPAASKQPAQTQVSDKQIKSIAELNQLLEDKGRVYCYISFKKFARSSKTISLWENRRGIIYDVLNEIDGSYDELTEKELWTESNIGEALDSGALYLYEL
jgi:hypothetical protein